MLNTEGVTHLFFSLRTSHFLEDGYTHILCMFMHNSLPYWTQGDNITALIMKPWKAQTLIRHMMKSFLG